MRLQVLWGENRKFGTSKIYLGKEQFWSQPELYEISHNWLRNKWIALQKPRRRDRGTCKMCIQIWWSDKLNCVTQLENKQLEAVSKPLWLQICLQMVTSYLRPRIFQSKTLEFFSLNYNEVINFLES